MIALTNEAGQPLTPDQVTAYQDALVTSHRIRTLITLLDHNEAPVKGLIPQVLTGAVQVDATQAVTRSLSMTYLDPNHKLTFDSSSPSAGAFYADNFIQVSYGVETALGWVDVPVFTGPVTAFSRTGPEVTVEAQGKESLALDPHLVTQGYVIGKNSQVRDGILAVVGRLGEKNTSLGMVAGRMTRHRTVGRGEEPWLVLVGGSQDANGKPLPGLTSKAKDHPFLFYDGRGTLTAKGRGGPAKWDFTEQQITSQPGYTYDVLDARNRVYVEGGTPKAHPKKHWTATAVLPASHPLSAQSLARNGRPRYLTTMAQSDSLKGDHACQLYANRMLSQLAHEGLTATFDTLPVPHLEELDPVRLVTQGYVFSFPLSSFSIPLTHDQVMTVGAAGQATISSSSPAAHHTRHHHHHHRRHHRGRSHH